MQQFDPVQRLDVMVRMFENPPMFEPGLCMPVQPPSPSQSTSRAPYAEGKVEQESCPSGKTALTPVAEPRELLEELEELEATTAAAEMEELLAEVEVVVELLELELKLELKLELELELETTTGRATATEGLVNVEEVEGGRTTGV